jgi:hypothetical protein
VYNYAVRSSINIDMEARIAKLLATDSKPVDAALIGQMFK